MSVNGFSTALEEKNDTLLLSKGNFEFAVLSNSDEKILPIFLIPSLSLTF